MTDNQEASASETKDETKVDETKVDPKVTKAELAAKNAELEKKLAEMEALLTAGNVKPSATSAKVIPATDANDKRPVTIELPYDGEKYKDDLYVSINQRDFQIKRGVPVVVPFYVAQAIKESADQDRATARMIQIKEMEYNKLSEQGVL